jgi:hypothetical protein
MVPTLLCVVRRLTILSGLALAGLSGLIGLVKAADTPNTHPTPSESMTARTVERRAIEAMNWGMSAVNTDLMRQEMLNKTAGKVKPGRLLVASARLAQPNADAQS